MEVVAVRTVPPAVVTVQLLPSVATQIEPLSEVMKNGTAMNFRFVVAGGNLYLVEMIVKAGCAHFRKASDVEVSEP